MKSCIYILEYGVCKYCLVTASFGAKLLTAQCPSSKIRASWIAKCDGN